MNDLRSALRQLRRRPGFTATAILTLALGIGASTAIYSVLRGVLMRPLPYSHPEALVTFEQTDLQTGFPVSLSIPNYRDWFSGTSSFESFGATDGWSWVARSVDGTAEMLRGQLILGGVFETLGVHAYRGHLISPAATDRGAPRQVVLSYAYWQRRFAGKDSAIGSGLRLDHQIYTVVGVLPPGWGWPDASQEIYVPMGTVEDLPWDERDSAFGARAIARLASGKTFQSAEQDLRRTGEAIAAKTGDGAAMPRMEGVKQYLVGDVEAPLLALAFAVGLVLVIAIANVANLQLAQGERRRGEIALRGALGAGRARLARQLMAESLTLSLIAGSLGAALSWAGVKVLIPLLPAGIPHSLLNRVGIDWQVLVFAVLVSAFSGLMFGLVPAVRAARTDPAREMLGDSRTTSRRGAFRAVLVAAELALAMALLVGTGLMIRSFEGLTRVDKGFDARRVLTARLVLGDAYSDPVRWTQLYERLLERLRGTPGVRHAAASLLVPLTGRSWEMGAVPEGVPIDRSKEHSFLFNIVSEDYFRTLGVPILKGRGLTAADRSDARPVAVIDERMAEQFWPGESPLGKRVFLQDYAPESTHDHPVPVFRTVVGVAKNIRHYSLSEPSRMQAYISYRQVYRGWGKELNVLVKTSGDPAALAPVVRREVRELDPNVPLTGVRSMQSWVDDALSANRAMDRLLTFLGVIAVSLAAIGVFGVMSYSIAQRTRELAIRVAVGADRNSIVQHVLLRAGVVAAIGLSIGLAAGPVLVRLVRGLLYEVSPFEPWISLKLAVFMLLVAALAAYLPVRRAARVDPMEVLRHE